VNTAVGWTEVRVLAPLGWCELVGDVLARECPTGVAHGRPSLGTAPPAEGRDHVRAYVSDEQDTPAWRERVGGALAALAELTGACELRDLGVEFRELPPEDYATSWRKAWKPFRLGRLCLVPDWSASDLRPTDMALRFEPGGAFGSGRHATTRLCLRALQERLVRGSAVLDAGSGSGILAVSACLLGARSALGFDIDPHARRYAFDLARRNDLATVCEFRTGGVECIQGEEGPFDAVLANLYSDLLQQHAAAFARWLAPDGWFAFSGCPDRDGEATRAAIEAAGLRVDETRRRGRWLAFVGQRR